MDPHIDAGLLWDDSGPLGGLVVIANSDRFSSTAGGDHDEGATGSDIHPGGGQRDGLSVEKGLGRRLGSVKGDGLVELRDNGLAAAGESKKSEGVSTTEDSGGAQKAEVGEGPGIHQALIESDKLAPVGGERKLGEPGNFVAAEAVDMGDGGSVGDGGKEGALGCSNGHHKVACRCGGQDGEATWTGVRRIEGEWIAPFEKVLFGAGGNQERTKFGPDGDGGDLIWRGDAPGREKCDGHIGGLLAFVFEGESASAGEEGILGDATKFDGRAIPAEDALGVDKDKVGIGFLGVEDRGRGLTLGGKTRRGESKGRRKGIGRGGGCFRRNLPDKSFAGNIVGGCDMATIGGDNGGGEKSALGLSFEEDLGGSAIEKGDLIGADGGEVLYEIVGSQGNAVDLRERAFTRVSLVEIPESPFSGGHGPGCKR
jgi:hypothetical protein